MEKLFCDLAAAWLLVAAHSASAAAGGDLKPAGPWILDYADDSCAMRRVFGEGSNRATLELRRFEVGERLQVSVTSEAMKAYNPANFRMLFADGKKWTEEWGLNISKDGWSGILFPTFLLDLAKEFKEGDWGERELYSRSAEFRATELARAEEIKTLELRGAFPRRLSLALPQFKEAMKALQDCTIELQKHWAIDVDAHQSLRRPAMPNNQRQVTRLLSYPPKMLFHNMPGIVNVRLNIDPAGLVTSCRIQMPLSDPAFEKASCTTIQKMNFDPALDKDGQPIASFYVTQVMFLIPSG